MIRLFALYRQAEMHRKALTIQKRYLQCQVDAFYQTQQSALLLMVDMGAPVSLDTYRSYSKYPRAYARFRAAGCVVIATLRFRYVLKRKMHHLKSHISKFQRIIQTQLNHNVQEVPSATSAIVCTNENVLPLRTSGEDRNSRQPSPIGMSTGIQSELSGHPATKTQHVLPATISHTIPVPPSSLLSYPSLLSVSPQQHQHIILSNLKLDSRSSLDSGQQFVKVNDHCTSMSMSHPLPAMRSFHQYQALQSEPHVSKATSSFCNARKSHTSAITCTSPSTHIQKARLAKSQAKVPTYPAQDPQLTAYIKGLERLKARLSKTNK